MALDAGGAAMALHEPEGELRVCGAIAPAAGGAAIAKEPEGDARVGAIAAAPFGIVCCGDPWGGGVRLQEPAGDGRVGGEPGSAEHLRDAYRMKAPARDLEEVDFFASLAEASPAIPHALIHPELFRQKVKLAEPSLGRWLKQGRRALARSLAKRKARG